MGEVITKMITECSITSMSASGTSAKDTLVEYFKGADGKTSRQQYDIIDEYVNTTPGFGEVLVRSGVQWPSSFDKFNGTAEQKEFFAGITEQQALMFIEELQNHFKSSK